MPGETVGVYTGQLEAGTQVSSTYEGRHITVREAELIHPYHAADAGLVDVGDPVIVCLTGTPGTYGNLVGVAFKSAAASTDFIAVDTEGIWNLKVDAYNDAGGVAVEIGDPLYIRAGGLPGATSVLGTGDADISKRNDNATQVFFGYALGHLDSTASGRIAVKIHAAPWPEQEERRYQTVATGEYSYGFHDTAILAAGESTGLHYWDSQITGIQTGGIYGAGMWNETDGDFVGLAGNLLACLDLGLYDTGGTMGGIVVGINMMLQPLTEPTGGLYPFRLNSLIAAGAIDAMFLLGNTQSAGLVADGAGVGSTKLGSAPYCSWGGVVYWVRLYDAAA